ncbi:MAG TPA: VWA domain-containing protein [Pyrinomonadaceae bacterium]|nr:VWA domain-containing protein [Pyrinomonadaceae bacterium]
MVSILLALLLPLVDSTAQSSGDPSDTVRVDSDLVDLKVSIVTLNPVNGSPSLEQKDFLVLEDGEPQEITFFAAADASFDLVLLLDLSGSTGDKIKLVRKSARRFVNATRPLDRVAVVTFTDVPHVVSGLTLDRKQLNRAIDEIEAPSGGTNFWDALRFVLERVLAPGQSSRRSAVVVMTDGVDNALPDVFGGGSRTTFEQLLTVLQKHGEVLVLPIYLDTEKEETKRRRAPSSAFMLAREQLAQIAATCGTLLYRAAKVKDLDTVYERVIRDLSTVYSIGYRPSNKLRDGSWRSVVVRLVARQDVAAHTKKGYYAKALERP